MYKLQLAVCMHRYHHWYLSGSKLLVMHHALSISGEQCCFKHYLLHWSGDLTGLSAPYHHILLSIRVSVLKCVEKKSACACTTVPLYVINEFLYSFTERSCLKQFTTLSTSIWPLPCFQATSPLLLELNQLLLTRYDCSIGIAGGPLVKALYC